MCVGLLLAALAIYVAERPASPMAPRMQVTPDMRFICSHKHKETIVIQTGAGGFPANIDVCDEWMLK
jgi:hypothetical protein